MKRSSAFVLTCMFVAATLVSVPVYADNPVLTFLQDTVMKALGEIQTGLNTVQTAVSNVQTTLNGVNTKVGRTVRFVTYSNTVVTHEGRSTSIRAGDTPDMAFNTIARYTVSVQPWQLASVPPGVDRLTIFDGVVDETGTPVDITIASIDPAGSAGLHVGPYAGEFIHLCDTRC